MLRVHSVAVNFWMVFRSDLQCVQVFSFKLWDLLLMFDFCNQSRSLKKRLVSYLTSTPHCRQQQYHYFCIYVVIKFDLLLSENILEAIFQRKLKTSSSRDLVGLEGNQLRVDAREEANIYFQQLQNAWS
ncbi:hypothetical protein ANCCAN_02002 [Ancylostoma caninum]|uniref:Uncharacterized protein n=1 Tax=Ancylostoma caninum TaxID=29170 RepID=A0A368H5R7_ANCCA|nr:hypothetical protein ANCCAN_02002 [Ancylostoma caninum]